MKMNAHEIRTKGGFFVFLRKILYLSFKRCVSFTQKNRVQESKLTRKISHKVRMQITKSNEQF